MQTPEEFEQEMESDMTDLEIDQLESQQNEQMLNQQEFQEAYGVPEPDPQFNQHVFLAKSLEFDESEKVTFMSESELGRPLFNLRFLLDIEDIAKYYLDKMAKEFGCENKIAIYFREKINNICASGMSNKGFVQNLNVTRRMDTTRKRIKNLPDVKGGKK